MIDIKADFRGGLNLDDSLYTVPKNAYIDALNITRDAIEGSNDNALTNIVGNQLVSHSLPAGKNVCIGAFPNNVRNTVVYLVWNENNYDLILEYDNITRTISPIFTNLTDSDNIDVLGFTEHDKITSINIYNRNIEEGEGDLLFFIDSLGRPTTLDILRFKNGEYTPVTRDILDVCKRPPLSPPLCLYGNDTSRTTNGLRNKLFRFKTRYVYDNNENSTCSPIVSVPLPVNILDDEYNSVPTNNNKIDLTFNSGEKDVKGVQLLMSYVRGTNDWSDFALVDTVEKDSLELKSSSITTTSGLFNYITTINFSGKVLAGTIVDIYMRNLLTPGTVLAASYTAVSGDDINDVINGLVISATSLGYVTPTNAGNDILQIVYGFLPYGYLSTNITNVAVRDNISIPYTFYNDSTYPLINIAESIQLFDYVPDLANAQEMPNGNVLMYGGITEGYDRTLVPNVINQVLTVAAGGGVTPGSLSIAAYSFFIPVYHPFPTPADIIPYVSLTISGIPVGGIIIKVYMTLTTGGTPVLIGDYTTISTDTLASITTNLTADIDTRYTGVSATIHDVANHVIYVKLAPGNSTRRYSNTTIEFPALSGKDSIATFPFSTQRKIGIAYFDKKGKTNGILYNGGLTFPAYSENGSQEVLLPYINTKIYHQPPEWAYSYNFYLTKEATQFLYWEVPSYVIAETNYIFFNISNLGVNQKRFPTTTSVLSYTFQEGDRMRLVRRMSDDHIFTDNYDAAVVGQIVVAAGQIPGVAEGTYIKIKNTAPFSTGIGGINDGFVIQLYRPEQQLPGGLNEVYYEFGQQYYIGDPTLSTRFHQGMVTSQNISQNIPAEFNFYEGDVYFRPRVFAISDIGTAQFNALDRNFVDNYISAVNSIDGRASVIDINARRAYYSTLVRFSGAYQANTNINDTNRFYPNNFDEYDYSYGDIMRLKVRDRFVRVFQKLKVGQVPLYAQILKEQNKENLVVTDRLLNPIQYYIGDVGIGEHAESLASYNFADYFTSNIKGYICRVSNDGVKFISIEHNVDSWATQYLPLRTGNHKVYGAYDQRLGNYIMALEATETDPAQTLLYDDNGNSFDTFLSYHPEMMTCLGVLFITFKDGELYTHDAVDYNKFYGVDYDSSVTFVFNQNALDKKTFLSLAEIASQIWDVPSLGTDVNSYGTTKMTSNLVDSDFAELEGSFEAGILRDQNSIGGLIEGDTMKGKLMTAKFRAKVPNKLVSLNLVSLKYINSPLNNR